MNSPQTQIQVDVKKAEAWLGSNWYPFLIGCGTGVVATLIFQVLHKVL